MTKPGNPLHFDTIAGERITIFGAKLLHCARTAAQALAQVVSDAPLMLNHCLTHIFAPPSKTRVTPGLGTNATAANGTNATDAAAALVHQISESGLCAIAELHETAEILGIRDDRRIHEARQ